MCGALRRQISWWLGGKQTGAGGADIIRLLELSLICDDDMISSWLSTARILYNKPLGGYLVHRYMVLERSVSIRKGVAPCLRKNWNAEWRQPGEVLESQGKRTNIRIGTALPPSKELYISAVKERISR